MKFLVVLFFAGVIGSSVVVVLTFVEDFKDIFSDDEAPLSVEKQQSRQREEARAV